MTTHYRIAQGVRALLAYAQTIDYTPAKRFLTPPLFDAFQQMSRSEQLHSLRVLRSVLAQDATTPDDLAIAALMHDCGKVCYPQGVFGKSLAVIVRRLIPPLYRYGSRQDPQRSVWARAFIVAEHHPAWGAAILAQLGASERAVWLVATHQDSVSQWMDHPHAALLWRLQRADDTN